MRLLCYFGKVFSLMSPRYIVPVVKIIRNKSVKNSTCDDSGERISTANIRIN